MQKSDLPLKACFLRSMPYMAEINFCPQCGTAVPADARFCPKCGRTVLAGDIAAAIGSAMAPETSAPLPPTPAVTGDTARVRLDSGQEHRRATEPPPRTSPKAWLIGVPVTVIVLGLLAWAVLQGLPFGGHDQPLSRNPGPQLTTIGEGSAATTTVSQIVEPEQPITAPQTGNIGGSRREINVRAGAGGTPATATAIRPPQGQVALEAVPRARPALPPNPAPLSDRPKPTRNSGFDDGAAHNRAAASEPEPSHGGQLSETEAVGRLRSFLMANNPYDVPASCLDVRSQGFSNRGYTLEVVQTECDSPGGEPHTLGRWRVDTLTREVFRQRNGHYLRP